MKVFFGLAAVMIVGSVLIKVTGSDVTPQAEAWARDMGYDDAKVHCQRWDNDGNGKLSCDVKTDAGIVAIDCSYFPFRECTQRKMVDIDGVPSRGRR